jgi:Bacterial Ig domain/Bacterial lectin/PA14 domain/Bacterial Ig-like domain
VGAFGGADLKSVTIHFSKKLEKTTAETLSNYTITGLTLSNPKLQANATDVVLSTTTQTPGTAYTITINGVKDLVGNVTSNVQAHFTGATKVVGGLRVDLFFGITSAGTPSVDELTSDPRYPNSPDQTVYWPDFGPFSAGNNYGDNYGALITGWIVPPVTGNYKFYLRSDDAGELDLSTDDTPANAQKIAEQTACCNAFTDAEGTLSSSPIALTAGKEYWVRALLKEGGGDDYLQVGWRTPSDADLNVPPTQVIGGNFLKTIADPSATISITQQPTNATVVASTPVSFTVGFTSFSAFGSNAVVQWQKASGGGSTFTNIPGTTSATYAIPFASASDTGAQFRAAITAGATTVNSSAATLTVSSDTVPPTIVSLGGTASSVTVVFSEPLDAASAGNKANYQIDGGASVSAATVISGAGKAGVVRLDISGATAGKSYNLTVTAVKDSAGNAIVATTRSFVAYSVFSTFDDGAAPTGAALTGSADVQPSGSHDDSGFLELTAAVNGLTGSIIYPSTLTVPITKFTATWKMFIGQGSANPADGVSFVISPDLADTANFGEEGTGTGVIVEIDTYDNANYCQTGIAEGPAIVVKYGGTTECPMNDPTAPGNEVVRTNLAKAVLVNNRWVDVAVQVSDAGKITVIYDNVKYFDNVQIPGWIPLDAGSRTAFGGRTGGEHEANWIDDVAILYNADLPLVQPPTISITSPANNATFTLGASVPITVNAQAPGGIITKVEFFANGQSIGSTTSAPYTLTVPNVPQGAYNVTAAVTDAKGVTITSAPVKVVVGSPPVVLFVTADPGPLTFAGDQAIYDHLLNSGFDVQITTGSAVPDDGSTANGKALVIVSSSLGSGTVVAATSTIAPSGDAKFINTPVPLMDWESALLDNFDFQADADPKGTTASVTDINIVDAANPLAAGLSAGPHTVVSSSATFSWGTPIGAHIVATMTADPTQACIFYYEKGDKTLHGTTPARRAFFFFQDNTAAAANADGWKLFDAEVSWLLNAQTNQGQPVLSVTHTATQLTISWTNGGTLQSNDDLGNKNGWTDVTSTTPAIVTPNKSHSFYRVKK